MGPNSSTEITRAPAGGEWIGVQIHSTRIARTLGSRGPCSQRLVGSVSTGGRGQFSTGVGKGAARLPTSDIGHARGLALTAAAAGARPS